MKTYKVDKIFDPIKTRYKTFNATGEWLALACECKKGYGGAFVDIRGSGVQMCPNYVVAVLTADALRWV